MSILPEKHPNYAFSKGIAKYYSADDDTEIMIKNTKTEAPCTLTSDTALKPCTYLLANLENGAVYTGVAASLAEQVWKHKNQMIEGFSKKFEIHTLVWFEEHDTIESAYKRAKSLKDSPFSTKQALVEQTNPKWRDLYSDLCTEQQIPALKTA